LRGGRVLSHFTLFSVVAVCCFLYCVLEMISFMVLFPVTIVKSDCQLIHSMEGGGFSLFPVCYQVLEVIWQSLVKAMAQNYITPVQLCCIPHEFHIVSGNLISWLYTKVVNEIGSILYWVQKSKMNPELFYKKVPSQKPGLCIAEVFLL